MTDGKEKERYLYIDNLRLLMIIFVVMMHLAVTYSGIGGWYTVERKELGIFQTAFFGLYQSFTQAYFMGFLFLISGYFVKKSYDKKGFQRFIKDRLIRLGIPTLIYMLLITPFIMVVLLDYTWEGHSAIEVYIQYIVSLDFLGSSGPLWFAFALLIFNIVYALLRKVSKKQQENGEKELPGMGAAILLILLIFAGAFLIRLVQPIGTSILNMQLCYFAQYIILFIVGVTAGKYRWFSKLTYQSGRKWLFAALVPGILCWAVIILAGGALNGNDGLLYGGLHWQSAAYALWESFTAVAMSIGLITVFREKYNKQSRFVKTLSDNSFAVYVFHAPVIIAVTLAMTNLHTDPVIKFLLACILGIPLSFLFSHYIFRRIPFLKKVL
ncbi:acyltransferase family protein [Anaerocolumna xylanovorans]|uniref:Peptidoglycan/LPS O-acetylase OafA/YrhL, contains acyltransferase and SGNH-hydrolase domains n=1 Tax=Anaerocolumna xylanovorans DSM 12503 TaxID=1121345 RepID=A0A1M7YL55_9FIRM|nr:acyltransferase family protein [Anaerocolumna xylanovorans]SHO53361.1 Peptidoglycan/LPS O-acetylase OafA/YrhL, contains acyltransferase and SGNH-hydrolase domains [Anaerocolumna xylanovorans DSM 12503]